MPEGRSCSPLGATGDRDGEKNLFATCCEATTSQGRSCCVCIRVYLYPSICVYIRPFPPDPRDGSGWKRVAGRYRRASPGGEGRTRPPLRSADEDGRAGEPGCSAASPFPGPAWERASGQRLWATCRGAAGLRARDWPKRKTSLDVRRRCVLAEGLSTLWPGVPLRVLAPLFHATLADGCGLQGIVLPLGD